MFIIYRAGIMAERTVIFVPFIGPYLDADMLYAICIQVKTAVLNNSVLNIQDIYFLH